VARSNLGSPDEALAGMANRLLTHRVVRPSLCLRRTLLLQTRLLCPSRRVRTSMLTARARHSVSAPTIRLRSIRQLGQPRATVGPFVLPSTAATTTSTMELAPRTRRSVPAYGRLRRASSTTWTITWRINACRCLG